MEHVAAQNVSMALVLTTAVSFFFVSSYLMCDMSCGSPGILTYNFEFRGWARILRLASS